MGIKIETILVVLISLVVFLTMTTKLSNRNTQESNNTKELEFYKTTFIEVDTRDLQAKLYTPYGVRSEGVLTLNDLQYHTPTIESLVAQKGSYYDNILQLDGNVTLKEQSGNHYNTEHAIYYKNHDVLKITSPFVASIQNNIFHGQSLVYNGLQQEVYATKIDAVVYPVEK